MGHGAAGTLADCAATRRGASPTCKPWPKRSPGRGDTADDAAALPVRDAYANWDSPSTFPQDTRCLYGHAQKPSE